MKLLLLAGLGGFIGSAGRYGVGLALLRRSTLLSFPLATLLVNVTGSFLIGFIVGHGLLRGWLADGPRAFLIAGVLGGFTTFSSCSYETLQLWRDGGTTRALLNVALNLTLCLLAVWCGDVLGRATAG